MALAAVVLLALGAAAGIAWGPERVPSSVQANEPTTAPVTVETFDDVRQVKMIPQATEESELTVGDTGRVAATTCIPGATIKSGSSPITIDDRPVIALATSVPLWRDLGPGTKGADVRALQTELARLGYPVTADGNYRDATRRAVVALYKDADVTNTSGSLQAASVLWLPATSVVAKKCAHLGAQVSDGPLVTTAGSLVSLRITEGTDGATPGPRMIRYGEASAPVKDGLVTDSNLLNAVLSGPEFAGWQRGDGGETLTLEYVLATPIDAAVVPPGALFALAGTKGCVRAEGASHSVSILSSSLGRAFVTFDDGAVPSTVQLTAQHGNTTCT